MGFLIPSQGPRTLTIPRNTWRRLSSGFLALLMRWVLPQSCSFIIEIPAPRQCGIRHVERMQGLTQARQAEDPSKTLMPTQMNESVDIRVAEVFFCDNPMTLGNLNPNKPITTDAALPRPPIRRQLPFGRRVGHGVIQTCHAITHGLRRPAQPVVADEDRLFGGVAR